MFERYTESARRVLFFARYEVTRLGATAIEPEHVLLGLLRDRQGLAARILAMSQVSVDRLREDIEGRSEFREKVSPSIEIPFSRQTQRVLRFAAEEAGRLKQSYVGTEHLLLGLLSEESSVAATILTAHGLRLDEVRQTLVQLLTDQTTASPSASGADVSGLIDEIKRLVEQLARMPSDRSKARALAHRIRSSLEALERHLAE